MYFNIIEESKAKLQELMRQIKEKYGEKNVWFFNDKEDKTQSIDEKIGGYLGTQDIMFIALNPSEPVAKNPSKNSLEFFYRHLKKYDFENAHITDLIKLIKTGEKMKDFLKKGDEDELMKQLGYLKQEIEIIKPVLIIALGKKSEKILKEKREYLGISDIEIIYLIHYADINKRAGDKKIVYPIKFEKIKEIMGKNSTKK